MFEPESASISDRVYQDLRWALIVGNYAPGDKVSARVLARERGFSPMPVREALKRLASERALIASAKRSFQVPAGSPKRISDLLFVRMSLEGIATELATPRLTAAEIARLAELANTVANHIENGDVAGYLAGNYSFHFSIYTASNNPELVSIIEGLWAQTGPFVAEGVRSGGLRVDWRSGHTAIVDAIRVRDSERARECIEQDIAWGVDHYRQLVEIAG